MSTRQPDPIAAHPDRCACSRCAGLEPCPLCGRIKLDIDWCWQCRTLVFTAQYRMDDGRAGSMPVIARNTFDAWDIAAQALGEGLCRLDVRATSTTAGEPHGRAA